MVTDLFMQLMRVALGKSERLTVVPTVEEWEQLMALSSAQGVMAVAFCGVERLPKEQRPPIEVIMDWSAVVDYIEQENRRLNRLCVKVCEMFQRDGKRMCVLKGQGMGVLYPWPLRRSNGDIDVWMEGEMDAVVAYVKEHFQQVEEPNLFHVAATLPGGVELEVHYRPVCLSSPKKDALLRHWMTEMEPSQWQNTVVLSEGVGQINVPTKEFDLVFILLHLFHHWVYEGCGMKPFMDYYWLVESMKDATVRAKAVEVLRTLGLNAFLSAVMFIFKEWGMQDEQLLCPSDKRLGQLLLEDVLTVGIVTGDDLSVGRLGKESKFRRLWRRCQRMWKLMPLAPHEIPWLLYQSLFWRLKAKLK